MPNGKPMALSLSSALGSTISCTMGSHTSPGLLSLKAYKRAKLTNIGNAVYGSPFCDWWPPKVLNHCDKRAMLFNEDPKYHSRIHWDISCDQPPIIITLLVPCWSTINVGDVLESPLPPHQLMQTHQECHEFGAYSPMSSTLNYL